MQHPSTNLLTTTTSSASTSTSTSRSTPIRTTNNNNNNNNTNTTTTTTNTTTTTRRSLPPRKARSDTIEDAYVQFILYCNPGVPPGTDTAALREAFRVPPKSGGKSFSTHALFGLIRQFQNKEIRTWAELALRLGVEPPDQDRGQSTQKIQQYAVRLKRWMHSMHLDAFFDYMLNNPHPYWTEVPQDPNPVTEDGRDGVAAEDDMALRSLLPQIRPRRGRKRPDDEDSSVSPSQRPRMEGGGGGGGVGGGGSGGGGDFGPGRPGGAPAAAAATAVAGNSTTPQQLDLWSAHSEGAAASALFPPQDQYARMDMDMGGLGGVSWPDEAFVHTPLVTTAHPYSAITPSSTGQVLWPEQPPEEPRSAITPTTTSSTTSSSTTTIRPRQTNRRHGAKVVSSAWRSGGPGGSGKTRGRPPLNRQLSGPTNDPSSPFSAFPAQQQQQQQRSPHVTPRMATAMIGHSPNVPAGTMGGSVPRGHMSMGQHQQQQQQEASFGHPQQGEAQAQAQAQAQARDLRPIRSRLSLHVPERAGGGGIRLATPPGPQQPAPPVVMINGSTLAGHQDVGFGVHFTDPTDRTNLDEVESLFTYDMVGADWFDPEGNPTAPCGVDEAAGISRQIIEDVRRGAASKETFLVNVAALAGSSILRGGKRVRVQRAPSSSLCLSMLSGVEGEGGDEDGVGVGVGVYDCHWELRLGDIKGTYSVRVVLPDGKWKGSGDDGGGKGVTTGRDGEEGEGMEGEEDAEGEEDDSVSHEKGPGDEAERWQRKYRDLLETVQQQKTELSDFRKGIIKLCQTRTGEGG
ncbi:hypothetical protein VMCG_09844 [Cytospora schulzeri]|uniref:ARS-binding protein 2 n=1 Tax=Cytospora schulzeri TaxID=448051 RepID=A0A423VDV8_9PEZI|nr:hypothetical protein VMCG_09844 [Valsa malicola]